MDEAVGVAVELGARPGGHPVAPPVEAALDAVHLVDGHPGGGHTRLRTGPPEFERQASELLAALGRGDEGTVGHLVGHRLVARVADAGPYRGGGGGDGPCHPFGVEGGQVGLRPSTSDHDDDVAVGALEPADTRRNRGRGVTTLHLGLGDGHLEGHAGVLEATQEVAVALGSGAGDQPDAERKGRNREATVAVIEAFVDECLDQPGAFGGNLAEQRVGIELGEGEVDDPAGLVELRLAAHSDDHPGIEGDTQLVEGRANRSPSSGPADDLEDGRAVVVGVPGIDQIHVTDTARADAERADLTRHPDLAWEGVPECAVDAGIEVHDGEHVDAGVLGDEAAGPGLEGHGARLEPRWDGTADGGWLLHGWHADSAPRSGMRWAVVSCGTMVVTVSRPGGRGRCRPGGTPDGNRPRKVGTPQGRVLANGQSG